MDYSFGVARNLYSENRHPRVFFGEADLLRLREEVKSGTAGKIMAGLRRRIAEPVRTVLNCDDLPPLLGNWNRTWHEPSTRVVFGLQDMAVVAAIDEDANCLEAVRRVLAACPEAERAGRQEAVRNFGYSAIRQLAMAYDAVCPSLSEAERRAFCAWAVTGIEATLVKLRPRYFLNAGGNMPLGGMVNALTTVLAIAGEPGVPDLVAVRDELVHMLEATLRVAINPDGYPEEDIGYGTSVAGAISQLAEALRRAGLYDVYTACPRYARFGRAMLHFVQPWGRNLSNTGDHGDDFGGREFVLARLAQETGDPTLIWLARTLRYNHGRILPENDQPDFYVEVSLAEGEQIPASTGALLLSTAFDTPEHPLRTAPPTAFCDCTRGLVSFRSGWDAEATFVVFDGSQRSLGAQGHAHASGGHFSLSALGEYFSIDTGRYNVEQSCHSVVLAGGKSGRTWGGEWRAVPHAGLLTAYEPGELVDTASVDSALQHNCYRAKRELFLIKGQGVTPYVIVVDDLNVCDDWSEYWWQLHSSPENTIETGEESATITGWRHGNKLAVHFALPAATEYPKPHTLRVTQDVGVPSSINYLGDLDEKVAAFPRPAAMVHGPVYKRPRLLGIVGGYNGRFLTAMLPYRKGDGPPTFSRLPSLPGTLAVRVAFADVADTFIYSYENHLLEADGIVGRGRWCLVRRGPDGSVLAQQAPQADSLEVGG